LKLACNQYYIDSERNPTGGIVGNLGKKVFLFYLLITMADKLSAIAGSRNKIFKVLQFVDYRFPSLVALLDGRNHNLVYAVYADDLAFRELAVEERDFIEADFRSLLCHPFFFQNYLFVGE
jgi:hypothetical protein